MAKRRGVLSRAWQLLQSYRYMTDWKMISKALNSGIPDDELDKIVPVLETLERAFEPLRAKIPTGSDVWLPEGESK